VSIIIPVPVVPRNIPIKFILRMKKAITVAFICDGANSCTVEKVGP